MLSGNIKVVNVIAHVIAVGKHAAARAHRQVKGETALVAFAARMHPRFHHALADRRGVVEFRQMLDGIEHDSSSPCSVGASLTLVQAALVQLPHERDARAYIFSSSDSIGNLHPAEKTSC